MFTFLYSTLILYARSLCMRFGLPNVNKRIHSAQAILLENSII